MRVKREIYNGGVSAFQLKIDMSFNSFNDF
jgi:hypothetical protein